MSGSAPSLVCARCGESLAGWTGSTCPRCGLPVAVSMGQPSWHSRPLPSGGSGEAPLYPSSPPSGGGAQMGYGYPQDPRTSPGYGSGPVSPGPYPSYGQGMPPNYPAYGQPAAPSAPLYGQGYGQAPQPSYPIGQPSGWGGPPSSFEPPTRRTGLIVGLVLALLLVIAGGGAAYFVLLRSGASSTAGNQSTPQPTATATTALTPTPTVVYHSALTGSLIGWPKGSGCSPQADGYHVIADVSCFAPTQELADFSLTVTAKEISGDTSKLYGVTFRSAQKAGTSDIGNTYGFLISNDKQWILFKLVGNTPAALGQGTSAAIHTGLNVIQVLAKGAHLAMTVNGSQLTAVDDSSIAKGKCGLQGFSGGHAVFTDLTITNA